MKTIALNLIAGLEASAGLLTVGGPSLSPVLRPAGIHWMNHVPCLLCHLGEPKWEDLVLLWTREGWALTRVIGLPGDALAMAHGSVQVNGHDVPEACVVSPEPWLLRADGIHGNRCVVLGDIHVFQPRRWLYHGPASSPQTSQPTALPV